MSGSVKDDKPVGREPQVRELRQAPAASGSIPKRPASQKLFELDAPSTSGAHALGLAPLTAAAVKLEGPANDVVEPADPEPARDARRNSEIARESAAIDAQFAALLHMQELEAPLAAAAESARHSTEPRHFDTRLSTHVAPDQTFDATLKLPRSRDTLEARRGRLAVRYKSACAAYKVLSTFEISATTRKELVDLFSSYEASLRTVLPPSHTGEKRDSDHLHSSLPAPGFDEHERALTRIEDRLLALDDSITEDEFRASVSLEKHPPKSLLRYARVLAMRRFNIGYRRDRFEYLAFELLTSDGPDGRLQLSSRDQAGPVLLHLLAGLPQVAALEERGPAIEHMREALDRLAEIEGSKEFFDSEFFIDLHGYKISMRDQITCPEFLYLSAAVHVELHNRMLAWSRSGTASADSLRSQLQAQQRAAEEVFSSFRHPRSTPAAKSSPRPSPAKEALPQTAHARRKKRKRETKEVEKPTYGVWAKLAALSLVIVLSASWLLYETGVFQVGTPASALTSLQAQRLSPLLLRATLVPRERRLEGLVSRPEWQSLSKSERRAAASDLAARLKQKNIPNARIMAYKSAVITIEFSTVVFVDES